MNINISFKYFSEIFWRRIFENQDYWQYEKEMLFKKLNELENLRRQATYNTGSINPLASWALYCLARFFKPKNVIEVGTFIGKSTLSIATAVETEKIAGASIHTCDQSNDIDIPNDTDCEIIQYKKSTSLDMLKKIPFKKNSCSFIHIDGRISKNDIELIETLASSDSIIVLDDFEGNEKGVANYDMLSQSKIFKQHIVAYPPGLQFAEKMNFFETCNTAVCMPAHLIKITRQ